MEDDIDANFLYDAVDDYNQNYPDYKFIATCGKTKTYIQGIQTSNGKYNLVLCQPRRVNRKQEKTFKNRLLQILKQIFKRGARKLFDGKYEFKSKYKIIIFCKNLS